MSPVMAGRLLPAPRRRHEVTSSSCADRAAVRSRPRAPRGVAPGRGPARKGREAADQRAEPAALAQPVGAAVSVGGVVSLGVDVSVGASVGVAVSVGGVGSVGVTVSTGAEVSAGTGSSAGTVASTAADAPAGAGTAAGACAAATRRVSAGAGRVFADVVGEALVPGRSGNRRVTAPTNPVSTDAAAPAGCRAAAQPDVPADGRGVAGPGSLLSVDVATDDGGGASPGCSSIGTWPIEAAKQAPSAIQAHREGRTVSRRSMAAS